MIDRADLERALAKKPSRELSSIIGKAITVGGEKLVDVLDEKEDSRKRRLERGIENVAEVVNAAARGVRAAEVHGKYGGEK